MYLAHHGVKGQKWGVRHGPPYPLDVTWRRHTQVKYTELNKAPKNTEYLKGYSGPAYFISDKKGFVKLNPRIPENYFTKHGFEDSNTKRVSFAPSIQKCLAGLSQNVEGQIFYVYSPDNIKSYKIYKPNTKAVPDSKITDELYDDWIYENL